MRTFFSWCSVLILSFSFFNCGQSTVNHSENFLHASAEEIQSIQDFIDLANAHRQNLGCDDDLIWDDTLGMIAQMHSQDMNDNHYLSHTNLSNQSPWDRLSAHHVQYTAAAENIAQNSMSANSVFQAWMDSPGHRANLENCIYTHHGVGLSAPGIWTHMFIRR